jgi:hypothetical protein
VIKRFGGCGEKYNFTDKKIHKFSLGASDLVLFKIIMHALRWDLKDLDVAVKTTILRIKNHKFELESSDQFLFKSIIP